MSNPITSIKTEELTHYYSKIADKRKYYEREWAIADKQLKCVLAEVTGWYHEKSYAANERLAKVSKEYQEYMAKRADLWAEVNYLRDKQAALEFEIKIRLNKSFTDRSEFKAGGLVT